MAIAEYINWCNENEGRAYPLYDNASQIDNKDKELPTDIIADMGISIPPTYTDCFISAVRFTSNVISVSIASNLGPVLTCTVDRNSYVPYTAVSMTPLVDDVSGWVVFGNHRYTVPELYIFRSSDQSGIALRAKRITDAIPVTKFRLANGDTTLVLQKLVGLVAGTGLRIFAHETTPNRIVIELDSESPQEFAGPCNEGVGDCTKRRVCKIEGVGANNNGILTIRFEGGSE